MAGSPTLEIVCSMSLKVWEYPFKVVSKPELGSEIVAPAFFKPSILS